jgi:alkylation response protein AidB-like acyl-CoA dehydrogenase
VDFGINPKYSDLVERASKYAKEMLAPRAQEIDREGKFPRENFEDLHREGFTALTLPEHLGGRDLYSDPATYATVLYELSKGCTNTAMLFHMQSSIIHVLCLLGTEEQAARYARAVHDGKIFASHASENTSSLHGKMVMDTYARRAGDKYIINGRKYFCSMAGEADHYVLWCQLGDEPDLGKSLYLFVAAADTPGFRIDKEWNSYAMQGTVSHSMIYEGVEVSENDIVGKGGDPIQPDVLSKFGFGYSAVYLGAGGGAYDWVVDYAKNRRLQPDNVPIATYPPISRAIGEIKIALDGALLMVQRAGWLMGTQGAAAAYGSINEAKYTAAETAAMITEKAIKIAGGSGLMRDLPLQRFHRDARAGLIMPPNTEKCLELAGKTLAEGKAGALMT